MNENGKIINLEKQKQSRVTYVMASSVDGIIDSKTSRIYILDSEYNSIAIYICSIPQSNGIVICK